MKLTRTSGLTIAALAAALVLPALARPTVALAQAVPPGSRDPRLLDELARDLARFQEAVKGYRTATNVVIRRAYYEKIQAIKGKYEPLINLNEKDERDRRMDAIAMFEAFLRKYPSDRRWTPDAMFRLAELYYEKSSDEFLVAQETYQKALDSPNPPTGEPPRPDYNNTVGLYRRMLVEFPNYRLLDAAYYLLGFCLGEMGQEAEGRQALLALTCANNYKPLDTPAVQKKSGDKSGPPVAADMYGGCVPVRKQSKFVPEAWTRIGEMHFDAAELPQAISAYRQVLNYKDSSYYDKALYKLAWSYYRDNHFIEAIKEFDGLVKWADAKKASGDKFGSDLRPEAIQYLGVSFSEPDWNGDTVPDAETGLQRADNFYRGREREPHVKEVYQRLGEIYFDATQYPEAIAVFKALLQKWPTYDQAPKIQDRVVQAYERDRNMVQAAKERELLGRLYVKGTEWYRANQNNPDALTAAQQLSEDALLTAATNIHAGAQACRANQGAAPAAPAPTTGQSSCEEMYKTSAELYEKYLNAYPNSKRAYEYSLYYADALFYSKQYERAIAAYTTVRDSVLDNRFQRDAAFYVIQSYEEIIERMKAARQLEDPPIPDESNTKPPVTALAMPDVYQKYLAAIDWYTANLNDEKIPDLRYAAAVLLLRYRDWPQARARLSQITDSYCGTKPEIGFKAYDSLLKTYFIDFTVQDEEQQDCALGRLLAIADQFTESTCSKNPAAAPYLARIQQIRTSVKSKVITKRLELAIENEEKGTERQLTVCREGGGGIAMVTGTGAQTGAPGTPGTPGQPGKPATPGTGRVSTEMDVGLALDLIDLVNQNPQDPDAPKNLNNVCVIYERLFQYGEATRCYERLATSYPDSGEGKDAVWNAAKNNERFFNFNAAVNGYIKIAEDPKFADHEHRKDALGLAATLLDNDQQYSRAASLYRRYSDAIADKPSDSAQAFYFGCNAYEKMNDSAKQRQCLNDLNKRYGTQPEAGNYVVESYLKLALLAEKSGDKNATNKAYQKVRDEFRSRGLQPATPAAAAAAKAEFLLVEEKFNAFKARPFKLASGPKAKATIDSAIAEAKSLQEEYKRVWDYRDATWTTASFLRRGDIFFEFGQKLVKAAETPPPDIVALGKKACRADPSLCGEAETQYKDGILQYVTSVEEVAKTEWKATLERAAQLGVTNEYVKKARENLSKYLPDEFPFVKDERPQLEQP